MWKGFRRGGSATPEQRQQASRRRGRLWFALHRIFDLHSGSKYQKLGKEPDQVSFSVENLQGFDGSRSIKMESADTYTKTIELQMKQDANQKILPINPVRLMRTLSIHHLECDNYVPLDGKVADNDKDIVSSCIKDIVCSHNMGSSVPSNNQIHLENGRDTDDKCCDTDICSCSEELKILLSDQHALLQEKLNEANNFQLNLQNSDFKGHLPRNQVKLFLEALEIFQANQGKFLEVIQDPNILSIDHIRNLIRSGRSSLLSRSASCPSSSCPCGGSVRRIGQPDSLINQDGKMQSEVFYSASETKLMIESNHDSPKMNQKDIGDAGPKGTSHETKIPIVAHKFRGMNRRITLDGIFDKIPVGHSYLKDRLVSERCRLNSNFGGMRVASVGLSRFRKSRSLTDSMDDYSRRLEFSLTTDLDDHASCRHKPMNEDGALQSRKNGSQAFVRILSLPEYQSYSVEVSPIDDSNVTLLPSVPLDPELVSLANAPNEDLVTVADAKNAVIVPERVSHNEVKDSLLQGVDVFGNEVNNGFEIVSEAKHVNFMSIQENRSLKGHTDSVLEPNSSPEIISGGDQMDCTEAIHLHIQEFMEKDSLEGTTTTCVDNYGYLSSKKHVETTSLVGINLDSLLMEVQSEDKAKFNYVTDILKLSGFCSSELQGRWHSPELPLDPSYFKELEGISPEQEICSCIVDLNINNLLLFDLLNEVLLEIYEINSFPYLLSSKFPSRISCKYEGLVFLKEVWASVNRHFSYQPQVDLRTDDIVIQDLRRDVDWKNWKCGIEVTVKELDNTILGNLLDEFIYEILSFSSC